MLPLMFDYGWHTWPSMCLHYIKHLHIIMEGERETFHLSHMVLRKFALLRVHFWINGLNARSKNNDFKMRNFKKWFLKIQLTQFPTIYFSWFCLKLYFLLAKSQGQTDYKAQLLCLFLWFQRTKLLLGDFGLGAIKKKKLQHTCGSFFNGQDLILLYFSWKIWN
jgi:hypothetical protein